MMDKIRKARTGKKKQAPAVKASRYMPAWQHLRMKTSMDLTLYQSLKSYFLSIMMSYV
jgi:hypothetical protein